MLISKVIDFRVSSKLLLIYPKENEKIYYKTMINLSDLKTTDELSIIEEYTIEK